MNKQQKKLSAEEVQLIQKRYGKEISLTDAQKVLDFIRRMASTIVSNLEKKI